MVLQATGKWLNMATVHWYKAAKEAPNTAQSLLDEAPLRREMDNLRQLVQVGSGGVEGADCASACAPIAARMEWAHPVSR